MLKIILLSFLLIGCATQQFYFTKVSLNNVSIGQTKQRLLNYYAPRGNIPPMLIRTAQMTDGKLIEVGEVLLTDGVSKTVPYWFLFEDNVLVRWGEPQDWKAVAARYEISYTPGFSR